MDMKESLKGFLIVGPIVFLVSLIVTYLYSLIVHGSGVWDWEMSIRLGIIFGIALPLATQFGKKAK